jgi:hypothetical protein
MYRIHRNVQSKLSKLLSLLKRERERAHLTSVRNLYIDGRFEFIENVQRKPCGRCKIRLLHYQFINEAPVCIDTCKPIFSYRQSKI